MPPREPIKPGNLSPASRQKVIKITSVGQGHDKRQNAPHGAQEYWGKFKSFVSAKQHCTVQDWLNYLNRNPILQPLDYTVESHLDFDLDHGFITLT